MKNEHESSIYNYVGRGSNSRVISSDFLKLYKVFHVEKCKLDVKYIVLVPNLTLRCRCWLYAWLCRY